MEIPTFIPRTHLMHSLMIISPLTLIRHTGGQGIASYTSIYSNESANQYTFRFFGGIGSCRVFRCYYRACERSRSTYRFRIFGNLIRDIQFSFALFLIEIGRAEDVFNNALPEPASGDGHDLVIDPNGAIASVPYGDVTNIKAKVWADIVKSAEGTTFLANSRLCWLGVDIHANWCGYIELSFLLMVQRRHCNTCRMDRILVNIQEIFGLGLIQQVKV